MSREQESRAGDDADVLIGRRGDRDSVELAAGRGTCTPMIGPDSLVHEVDLHVNTLRPGASISPIHRHSQASNLYLVTAGTVIVWAAGVEHCLAVGGYAYIAPGVPHGVGNPGSVDAELLEIYVPGSPDFIVVDPEGSV